METQRVLRLLSCFYKGKRTTVNALHHVLLMIAWGRNETNRCLMVLMIGKLPFYCISKRAIIAIKPEKILLTIGFIVMIIGKPPLAPCWPRPRPGLSLTEKVSAVSIVSCCAVG